MEWGLQNRLSRILKSSNGRAVMLAVDHGYFLGPTSGLEDPRKTLDPLIPHADAIMLTRGILRNCVDATSGVSVVLRVSGGSTVVGSDLANETIITSMQDAARLNVSAVALSVFIGSEYEQQTLASLARLVDQGAEYGMPVLGVTAVGKELEKRDARYLALCCRIVAELGAHIVKTYHCEQFDQVVAGCPIPIVIAGGPKLANELDALRLAARAIEDGAAGVDMGRNIWQSSHAVPMIRAVRAVVHENATPEEAHELFLELKHTEQPQPV